MIAVPFEACHTIKLLPRHDEHVNGRDGLDISKRHHVIVLINDIGRNFTLYDLGEEARHAGSENLYAFRIPDASAMHLSERWESKRLGDRILLGALTPLSWLYAAGWQAYRGMYRLGIKRPSSPHSKVICVGNLVTGGSGKSPMTLYLASQLREIGHKVVLGCSGYGSPAAHAAQVAPEGDLDPAQWGDEPAMFRWLDPGLPIIVGRRRVLAAELASIQFPDHVLLMDDGFQHLPLQKHLTVLLDRRVAPNSRCLPAGPYREPRRNRKLADLVLPGKFEIVADPLAPVRPDGSQLETQSVQVLCGLGHPQGFLKALRKAGFPLATTLLLPDHDPMTAGTLLAGFDAAKPIVTTAKDWVKLRMRPDLEKFDVAIARHRVRVEPEPEFRAWLSDRLNEFST